ncbi:MAG TPA: NAD-dependent epimerase/dehydratase family protein [Nocardioides sp.]|nr:NAD-dependent epimerase/dehydratase family protein [Nocardioides sp.]
MRIAVTGATGNVGTALLRRLTEGGGHELVGIARRPPNDEFPTVSWVSTDLTTDESIVSLREAFRDADAVVHLAWGFQPSHDPDHLEELGVGGTRRVIDAARDVAVPHLVHMSSVGAYSAKVDDEPVDESYPTGGIPSSPYSRHKAAAERLLEAHEAHHEVPRVTRLRPGIIGQRAAAGALLRYGLPGFVPARALRLIPVLPLDRRIAMPMVHADDVAAAIERVLTVSAYGAFNLAAPPTITPEVIGEVLDARPIHVPGNVLRGAAALTWRIHLQQVDPGWVDLAMRAPLLATDRARRELDWRPTVPADEVLRETVEGMANADSGGTPVLRPRTLSDRVAALVRRGPVSRRARP